MMEKIDPIALTKDLVRCPSVTPEDHGALAVLETVLKPMGFVCERMTFAEQGFPAVQNLYARYGTGRPHFCFAGHTDVVPTGDLSRWDHPPFDAVEEGGNLWGRGTADMKSGLAAFVTAAQKFLSENPAFEGSISLMITGDEEAAAINGTRQMVRVLQERGEAIDHCVVGEPTSVDTLGDMVKVGRRGSCNSVLTLHGTQGHVAYPHRADNPMPRLVRVLNALLEPPLDQGYDRFQPSNLEISGISTPPLAENVIPPEVSLRFNVRFNPHWRGEALIAHLHERIEKALGTKKGWDLQARVSGEAFLTTDEKIIAIARNSVIRHTGQEPELSTTGGTSDARFIRFLCPVVEVGLVGASIHKINEHAKIDDIHKLSEIYATILTEYFEDQ